MCVTINQLHFIHLRIAHLIDKDITDLCHNYDCTSCNQDLKVRLPSIAQVLSKTKFLGNGTVSPKI